MLDAARRWRAFACDLTATVDALGADATPLELWTKRDNSIVTSFDVRVDLAARGVFARHYPGVAMLSEELGWLSSTWPADPDLLAVLDPVDGTESLVRGRTSWWTSLALCRGGQPVAGVLHQPERHITHESTSPKLSTSSTNNVGLSPDEVANPDSQKLRHELKMAGLHLAPVPHAAEKVAAVLEGRCAASVYLPSTKSPSWRSWDLAACIPIAHANGIPLRTLDGHAVVLGDLDDSRTDAWVCARDERLWQTVRSALG